MKYKIISAFIILVLTGLYLSQHDFKPDSEQPDNNESPSNQHHHATIVAGKYTPETNFTSACSSVFTFESTINQQMIQGRLFLKGFGQQPMGHAFALHIETDNPVKTTYSPFIVYTNEFGVFKESLLPSALSNVQQQKLLAFFYAMQWARNYPSRETDAIGEYAVKYQDDKKTKLGYANNKEINIVHHEAQVSFTDNSCYWDELKTNEILNIDITAVGQKIRVESDTLFERLEDAHIPRPLWLSGNHDQAVEFIKNYQPPKVESHFMVPPDDQLTELFEHASRSQSRNLILALLGQENFVNDFVEKLKDNRSQLPEVYIARIIALMSVKNTETTQNAILTLLATESVNSKHRFQAAVAMGDFNSLYIPDVSSKILEQFNGTTQPAAYRSALVASLGRLASNIKDKNPAVYREITMGLFQQLEKTQLHSQAKGSRNEKNILLDAIYNSKVHSEDLLQKLDMYSKSEDPSDRAKSAAIFASAGESQKVSNILRKENDPATQIAILQKAALNPVNIAESVTPLMSSRHSQVRAESINYLARQTNLDETSWAIIANQFHHENTASNRGAIFDILKKHNKLALLESR
ncbi:hypothetical protein KIH87_17190 [Paraneptunicella aestuarii]|uniref:hypothetical protein n=1 Tax=Paraneptunicella aestuarii TaxID=2831148 RepID=UPI001E6545AA|nr:hypothetical protein [Paraneptunicella aestuarii]UAA38398.1 hypothetical protein KIH87_17190 [Paraneptunicella aestuarii]